MSNDDKLKVRQTESKKKAFKELTLIRDTIFWIDVVGDGQNENAIFARPFNEKEALPQKLTSRKYNIKNNFHGYGGKSYKCINFKNKFYLIWIDQITKAVWFQIFKEAASNYRSQNKYLDSVQEPDNYLNQLMQISILHLLFLKKIFYMVFAKSIIEIICIL